MCPILHEIVCIDLICNGYVEVELTDLYYFVIKLSRHNKKTANFPHNQKLTQQHNWKKSSSSPSEAWAGSSSPREASVFY
jgi:hypothetical protein